MRKFCTGNRMVAEGALAAGCRFFAGYPITPASEIYQVMMDELPRRGGLALAAPDEISSLCYCVGASLHGLPAMTATSGPGWALMIETFQYALMTETPLVVALVQRLGPSTGGATQGGQGDLWLAEYSTSGGYTVPVFAPSSAAECYSLTRVAFAWAERLRTPVILLSDKEVGMTAEVVEAVDDPAPPAGPARRPIHGGGPYRPYDFAAAGDVPPFAPVGGPVKVTVTGSAHDRDGHLRKNDPEVLAVLRHLQDKIAAHADAMALARHEPAPGARTLVIAYGITARAAREAVTVLAGEGYAASLFQPLTLFPVPEARLAQALQGIDTVVVVEENLTGQYRAVLRPWLEGRKVVGVNRIGGLIPPSAIVEAVREAAP